MEDSVWRIPKKSTLRTRTTYFRRYLQVCKWHLNIYERESSRFDGKNHMYRSHSSNRIPRTEAVVFVHRFLSCLCFSFILILEPQTTFSLVQRRFTKENLIFRKHHKTKIQMRSKQKQQKSYSNFCLTAHSEVYCSQLSLSSFKMVRNL